MKKFRTRTRKKEEDDAHATICRYIAINYPDVIFTSDASGLRLTVGLRKRFSRLKSETGIPDLLIFEPRGGYYGLMLEIKKADDNTVFSKKDGKLLNGQHIREQAVILDRLKHKGYATYFCIGSKMGIEIIDEYMKAEKTTTTTFYSEAQPGF